MKLGSFEIDGRVRLGAFDEEHVIDLNAAYCAYLTTAGESSPQQRADTELPGGLQSFIESNETAVSAAGRTLDFVREKYSDRLGYVYALNDITFRASHRPPKIVCTGTRGCGNDSHPSGRSV
jgi:hypothetical protein